VHEQADELTLGGLAHRRDHGLLPERKLDDHAVLALPLAVVLQPVVLPLAVLVEREAEHHDGRVRLGGVNRRDH